MATKIFVNLPVSDLQRSISFFTGLGFALNPQFTDDTAACIVLSEENYVMLLTHAKFREFTRKEITDSRKQTEVILALSDDSREAVDEMADKALSGGGSESNPAQDLGFMYQRSFQDPDGHLWEVLHMDMSKVDW